MNIAAFRIITGEVLVAKYEDFPLSGAIKLTDPRVLIVREERQQGSPHPEVKIYFMPYGIVPVVIPPFDEVELRYDIIVHGPVELDKRMEDYYLSTVSQIQIATPSSIKL